MLLFCEDDNDLGGKKRERKDKNGENGNIRFIWENLEINHYNLPHYTEEKNEAQRWDVFLKTT